MHVYPYVRTFSHLSPHTNPPWQIIERKDEEGGFHKVAEFDHPYPVSARYHCKPTSTPRH